MLQQYLRNKSALVQFHSRINMLQPPVHWPREYCVGFLYLGRVQGVVQESSVYEWPILRLFAGVGTGGVWNNWM